MAFVTDEELRRLKRLNMESLDVSNPSLSVAISTSSLIAEVEYQRGLLSFIERFTPPPIWKSMIKLKQYADLLDKQITMGTDAMTPDELAIIRSWEEDRDT